MSGDERAPRDVAADHEALEAAARALVEAAERHATSDVWETWDEVVSEHAGDATAGTPAPDDDEPDGLVHSALAELRALASGDDESSDE
jgi:hypothetical protein